MSNMAMVEAESYKGNLSPSYMGTVSCATLAYLFSERKMILIP